MIRTHLFRLLSVLALSISAACSAPPTEGLRLLAMGDSLMAWNSIGGQSIPDEVARRMAVPVTDRSVAAARMIYKLPISGAAGLSIPKQFRGGPWDWVIVNGGGNDLFLGCGCAACDQKLDALISIDGTSGAIPALVQRIRKTGARVVYFGYLRTPGRSSPIENCRDEGDALDARLTAMAAQDPGVVFLSLADMVPHRDLSYHALDRIHPSPKASAAIAARVVEVIRSGVEPDGHTP